MDNTVITHELTRGDTVGLTVCRLPLSIILMSDRFVFSAISRVCIPFVDRCLWVVCGHVRKCEVPFAM